MVFYNIIIHAHQLTKYEDQTKAIQLTVIMVMHLQSQLEAYLCT